MSTMRGARWARAANGSPAWPSGANGCHRDGGFFVYSGSPPTFRCSRVKMTSVVFTGLPLTFSFSFLLKNRHLLCHLHSYHWTKQHNTSKHALPHSDAKQHTAQLHGSDPVQGKRVPLLGAPKRHHSLQARDLYPSPGRPDTGEAMLLYRHSHVSDRFSLPSGSLPSTCKTLCTV